MPINFDTIFNSLKEGVSNLANTTLKEYVTQATADGNTILNNVKNDFPTWASELSSGALHSDDLTFLILERGDALKMAALTQAGILEVEADQFKNGVVNLIVTTLSTAVKL
jgi:hypothetical protein